MQRSANPVPSNKPRQLWACLFLIVALALLISACVRMEKSAFPKTIEGLADFQLTVEQAEYSVSDSRINCTIFNNSDYELLYGEAYTLEVLRNGTWYAVPFKGVDSRAEPTWPAIAYILSARAQTTNWSLDLARHDNLKAGEYRLIKNITLRDGKQTRHDLVATFKLKP